MVELSRRDFLKAAGTSAAAMAILALGRVSFVRLRAPMQRIGQDAATFYEITWEEGIRLVAEIFRKYQPDQIAFLLGETPDHLSDLVRLLSAGLGGIHVLRFSAQAEREGRINLMDAAQLNFGSAQVPYFDLESAELIYLFGTLPSFGGLQESWLRQRHIPGKLVYFGAQAPRRAGMAMEWVRLRPGSDGLAARLLSQRVNALRGEAPRAGLPVEEAEACRFCGLRAVEMEQLAQRFARARRKLAAPGGLALFGEQGVANARAVMELNASAGSLGAPGGVFLLPELPVYPQFCRRPSSLAEIRALVEGMRQGKIKALFVHGFDPLAELSPELDFAAALREVEKVVAFSPWRDRLSDFAGVLLPDHATEERWGYQILAEGSDRMGVNAVLPAHPPLFDTRATVDVLLRAAQLAGGTIAAALPYHDELDFIQQSLAGVRRLAQAQGEQDFWGRWQREGGWQSAEPTLMPPIGIF